MLLTWLRSTEKSLQGDQGSPNGEGGGPLVLQDIEADGSGLRADVRVPDLCEEFHLPYY